MFSSAATRRYVETVPPFDYLTLPYYPVFFPFPPPLPLQQQYYHDAPGGGAGPHQETSRDLDVP